MNISIERSTGNPESGPSATSPDDDDKTVQSSGSGRQKDKELNELVIKIRFTASSNNNNVRDTHRVLVKAIEDSFPDEVTFLDRKREEITSSMPWWASGADDYKPHFKINESNSRKKEFVVIQTVLSSTRLSALKADYRVLDVLKKHKIYLEPHLFTA